MHEWGNKGTNECMQFSTPLLLGPKEEMSDEPATVLGVFKALGCPHLLPFTLQMGRVSLAFPLAAPHARWCGLGQTARWWLQLKAAGLGTRLTLR